jgi:hypothetical protein
MRAPLLFLAAVAAGVLTAAALTVGLKSLRQESRTGRSVEFLLPGFDVSEG